MKTPTDLRTTSTTTPPRGFVLIIVLLVAAAALAIAVGLAAMSTRHRHAVQQSVGGDQAQALAQSGLERAEAYLAEIAKTGVDFDLALDPDLVAGTNAASCDILGAGITLGSETGVPRFTDGAIYSNAAFMNGAQFRSVAYGGGAYLVHVEDNSDDITNGAALVASTGNNPGTNGLAPFCAEGPTALSGADNPVRDADRAVWIVAVGIFPGTDPLTAAHRSVMRKLVISPSTPSGAALVVGHDLNCSAMTGNNTVGGAQVGHHMNCGASMCGSVIAGSGTNNAAANGACNAVNAFSGSTNATVPPVTVPAPEDARFYDWTTPCAFYIKDGDNGGFFYWDPQGVRGPAGGALCSTYTGNVVPPSQDVTVFPDSCWTPILLPHDGVGQSTNGQTENVIGYRPFEDAAGDQVNRNGFAPSGAGFHPVAGITATYTDPGTATSPWSSMLTNAQPNGMLAESYPTYFNGGGVAGQFDVHRPDWDTCSSTAGGSKSEVMWPPPPAAGAHVQCTTCNGGSDILVWNRAGGAASFQFRAVDPRAFVTAIYYKEGDWDANVSFPAVFPAAQTPASAWPMITVAVQNNVRFPNNVDVAIGVGTAADGLNGQPRGFWPSLIVGNTLDQAAGNAQLALAGALYVKNDAIIKKQLHSFGPIMVGNTLDQGSGGNPGIVWDYTVDTLGVGAATPAVPPIVAYPVNF